MILVKRGGGSPESDKAGSQWGLEELQRGFEG